MLRRESGPIVKICGLSSAEHARVAARSGADLLGFILAPSRRQVTHATVCAIRDELDNGPVRRPPFVGVFVNPSREQVDCAIEEAGIGYVQLSGEEEPALAGAIEIPYIRAIRIGPETSADDALRLADRWMSLPHAPQLVLVDAAVAGSYGGSGQRANWAVARQLAERYPTLLAGGLDPDNVAAGLAQTGAAGVDVSSGVEENGIKSAERIVRFIAAARPDVTSVDV